MRTLLIGIGNPLRRDDGVAHAVLELIPQSPEIQTWPLQELTPEVASELAACDCVIMIDADVSASALTLEPLSADVAAPARPFTHHSEPGEIVALSRSLFGFRGQAFLCRIPVSDVEPGLGLTARASEMARSAALEILQLPGWRI